MKSVGASKSSTSTATATESAASGAKSTKAAGSVAELDIQTLNEPESSQSSPSSTSPVHLSPMRISLRMGRRQSPLPHSASDAHVSQSGPSTIPAPRNPPTSSGRSFHFTHAYRFHDPLTGVQTAFLETTGRLHVKDDAGSLEIWEHARYFMVDCMRQNPGKSPDELLRQLTGIFGPAYKVAAPGDVDYTQGNRYPVKKIPGRSTASSISPASTGSPGHLSTDEPPSDAHEDLDDPSSDSLDGDTNMAKTNKKATGGAKVRMLGERGAAKATATTARHKSATKSAKAPTGDLKDCGCGCGSKCGTPKSTFLPGHDARFHGWIKRYTKGLMKLNEFNETVQKYIRSHGIKKAE